MFLSLTQKVGRNRGQTRLLLWRRCAFYVNSDVVLR